MSKADETWILSEHSVNTSSTPYNPTTIIQTLCQTNEGFFMVMCLSRVHGALLSGWVAPTECIGSVPIGSTAPFPSLLPPDLQT